MVRIKQKYSAVVTVLALFTAVLAATAAGATGPSGGVSDDDTQVTTEDPRPVNLLDRFDDDQFFRVDQTATTGALSYEMVWGVDATTPSGLGGIASDDGISVATGTIGEHGTFIVVVQIDDADDPTQYRFENAVPDEHIAQIQPDGSIIFFDADGNEASSIATPWAYDATGSKIPTSFALDGSTLVQTVEHEGAVYPVIADPCGWSWRGMLDCAVVAAAAAGATAVCLSGAGTIACGAAAVGAVYTYVQVQHPPPPPPPPPSGRVCKTWHYVNRNLCVQFY